MVKSGYKMKLIHNAKRDDEEADLLLIDEASMLSNFMYKRLEHNLANGTYKKVLLIYDDMQLPPVGDSINLAHKGNQTITLTQQMRQDPNKLDLASYLNKLRDAIAGGKLDLENPPPEVEYIEDFNEFAELYKNCEENKMILAHKNKTVDSYNGNISSNSHFMANDVVVLDKPFGSLKNQDTVTIGNVVEEVDRFCLTFQEFEMEPVYHYKSDVARTRALEEVMAKGPKEKKEERYWLLQDKCFSLKHLYAQTVFKSQGSSYSYVFVDGTDIMNAHYQEKTKYTHPISHNLMCRLLYVSISRMREKCYIYTGTKRNYPKLKPKKVWK